MLDAFCWRPRHRGVMESWERCKTADVRDRRWPRAGFRVADVKPLPADMNLLVATACWAGTGGIGTSSDEHGDQGGTGSAVRHLFDFTPLWN